MSKKINSSILKFRKNLFSIENRKKSWLIAFLFLFFLFSAFSIPKIGYDSFCHSKMYEVLPDGNVEGLASFVDVFRYTLCKTNTDFDKSAVEFDLYLFLMMLRISFLYMASIMFDYFLVKNISEYVLLGCCLLIWSISGMIYVSTYMGWF